MTLQSQTAQPPKLRGYRFWLSCLALILVMPLLLYYGYCWGLWGRHSLILQYLFQCNCPAASEEARYPSQVDVIVPACQYVSSIVSSSGKILYVQEETAGGISTYLLNLQRDEKTPFTLEEGSSYFLSDDLIFHSYYRNDQYILDRITNTKYSIQNATHLKPSVYTHGNVDPNLLLKALLQVNQVFFIDDYHQTVIALSSDFHTYPEHSFTFDRFDLAGEDTNRVMQFLQQNNVGYHLIPADFPHEAISPNGKFIARDDGIYLIETGQKIVNGYSPSILYRPYSGYYFSVRGWTYDNTSVIYSKFLKPCLIEQTFFISDEPGCFFEVPQPLIELKVPEQYLLPTQNH
jgi:hypothetical protein